MPWIQTFTGRMFDFETCGPDDIDIKDIAQGLSNTCRFAGQLKSFYSVAQHSYLASMYTRNPLLGLLHDSSEAYIHDVTRPLKKLLGYGYQVIEHRIMTSVWNKFEVRGTVKERDDLHTVDMRMLVTEAMQLHPQGIHSMWDIDTVKYPPYPIKLVPLTPLDARELFLERFEQLMKLQAGNCKGDDT